MNSGAGAMTGSAADVSHSVEHLFRHEAGRIISYLTRLLGPAHLDLAEESVQEALLKALRSWPYHGIPRNPPAWLLQVARNSAIDTIRQRKLSEKKEPELLAEATRKPPLSEVDDVLTEERLRDDELRMMFMCCHPALSIDAGVALCLKTVGGFGVREIARAFLADEATIAQRLVRAKRQIRDCHLSLDLPAAEELQHRLDAVLEVLYLMFNEGYDAHSGDELIRADLCLEALRLGRLVADASISSSHPQADALMALMAFQAARLRARINSVGNLVLLDHQDRSQWDERLIAMAFHYFERSMRGERVSRFHVEAAIAATHTRSRTSEETDWPMVLQLYDSLVQVNPSPVVALNRSVAVARVRGPAAALDELDQLGENTVLKRYYLYPAVRAQLLSELNRGKEAIACYRRALELSCNEPERRFLTDRISELES